MTKKKYITYIFWIYILTLLIATVIPWSTRTKIGIGDLKFRLDYWMHFGAYFGLAALCILRNYNEIIKASVRRLFRHLNTCISVAFYAELIQWIFPYRSFNVKDFLASALGVLAAYLLFYITKNWVKSSKRPIVRFLFE